jgi:cardiolipin synthase A/B
MGGPRTTGAEAGLTSPADASPPVRWLSTGVAYFARLHEVIAGAREEIGVESYIIADDATGRSLRDALSAAASRGVQVRVLADAFGAGSLPGGFWRPLEDAGGRTRLFNPLGSGRFFIRDHRKLAVVDRRNAFVGGFNVADNYAGDGVAAGWADCGAEITGPAAGVLAATFDASWNAAASAPGRGGVLGVRRRPMAAPIDQCIDLIPSGPGLSTNGLQVALRADLAAASEARIASAYFLPGPRLRGTIRRTARRGARVRLLFGARCDVAVARLAARHLYARLMRSGVEIFEYEPQVLHAKLFVIGDSAYVGSANLDARSIHLNHELTLRIRDAGAAAEAADLFDGWLGRSMRIDPANWRRSRSVWERLRERMSFWLLARLDPFVTRRMAPESDERERVASPDR